MTNYKYITELEEFDLRNRNVIPCINEEGNSSILIKNSKDKDNQTIYSTKYLTIKKNTVLMYEDKEYFFHIISCRDKTDYMEENFKIILEYLFGKLSLPISDEEFTDLLTSIQELFKKPSEDINTIQIGTAGELLTLLYIFDNGKEDILEKYHKKNNSKHDIELDDKVKIEVKTTTKDNRIHRFSHKQLKNPLLEIFISSVKLSLVEKGTTLYDLFIKVLAKVSNVDTKFNLRKVMNYCGVDILNKGIQFNFDPNFSNIKLIKSEDIPQIGSSIPDGVLNLTYDSICDLAPEINVKELIEFIK